MNEVSPQYTFTSCPKCHAVNKINISKLSGNKCTCGKCQAPLQFHQLVSEVDEAGLSKIIQKSDLPVIVDFWAPWCGPCKSFAPVFETVSRSAQGKIVFIKLNTENFPQASARFNIRGIPTLIVFKNGTEIARESGAFPLDVFQKWVTKFY